MTLSDSSVSVITRDIRQRDLVPPQRLAACQALVIGVGAIGRQVAMQLAALGMPRMMLVDEDHVAIENLAAQGYWPADLGQAKVEATAQLCRSIHPEGTVLPIRERFGRSSLKRLGLAQPGAGALICFTCVDSIITRKVLWESLRTTAALWIDGRMAAETLRVIASDRSGSDSYYASTLFDESQAFAGSCTARSTIYTASIAAGLMLAQFTRHLRQIPVERDQTLNLLACELTTF